MKNWSVLILTALLLTGSGALAAEFTDNADGTVSDGAHLIWQKQSSDKLSWEDANALCEKLELGGRDDWRIPTREELLTLVDKQRKDPAINIRIFPDTEPNVYWTSSREDGDIWTVGFSDGDEFIFDSLDYKWHTRCVAEKTVEPFVDVLMQWAAAWSGQDVDGYVASYGPEFKSGSKSRDSWLKDRQKKISRPKWIKVVLSDINVVREEDERVEVELVQSYTASNYGDKVRKSIALEKFDGDWKIVEEKTLAKLK